MGGRGACADDGDVEQAEEQARQAVLDGADYVGAGPMFRSATKPRDFVAGLEYAREVAAEIRIPAVAIAGITEENVDEVLATGIRVIAVTAAVCGCEDVEAAARRLKERIKHGDTPEYAEESKPDVNVSHR